MSWIQLNVSVANGSNVVTVNNNLSTAKVRVGDALVLAGFSPVEITGVYADSLRIASAWQAASQNGGDAAVMPTFGDFDNAAATMRQFTQATQGNLAAMEAWWTQYGNVIFKGQDNNEHSVRSAKQMDQDVAKMESAGKAVIANFEQQAESIFTVMSAFKNLRSESDMQKDRETLRRMFAGAGMIHSGLAYDVNHTNVVNEGLWTLTTMSAFSNMLTIGRALSSTPVGSSATEHGLLYMAGLPMALKGVGRDVDTEFQFKLPPAPNGAQTYDKTTGAFIDYTKDVDPKYGDVAATRDEAVIRAHEGLVKNADFRQGTTNWRKYGDIDMSAIDGVLYINDFQEEGDTYIYQSLSIPNGTPFIMEVDIASIEEGADLYIEYAFDGTAPHSYFRSATAGVKTSELTVPVDSGNGIQLRIRDFNNSGKTIAINSLTLRPKSVEVVTHPVDVVALEIYLREINEDDPILYPYGMQQCKLTGVDGIATVPNDFRPLSHFEVYPGDDSRGRGFNIFDGSLSDDELAQQFQKSDNHVYRLSDGRIVQWTLAHRTLRGKGNGDWHNLNPKKNTGARYSALTSDLITARGKLDAPSTTAFFDDERNGYNTLPESGMFTARNGEAVAVNGESYLYVLASVPRLNQGVWDPIRNPFGTATATAPGTINANHVAATKAQQLAALQSYPTQVSFFLTGNTYGSDFIPGRYVTTGSLLETSSYNGVRPDGKLHDVTYGDGENGVIDWRKPAKTLSHEDDAKVLEKCKRNTYRGLESLRKATITQGNMSGQNGETFGIYTDATRIILYGKDKSGQKYHEVLKVGDIIYAHNVSLNQTVKARVYHINTDNVQCRCVDETAASWGFGSATMNSSAIYIVSMASIGYSVSGKFSQFDVVSSVPFLINSALLSKGWVGGFVHVPPDGTTKSFPLSKPALDADILSGVTSNDGRTWVFSDTTRGATDVVRNERTDNISSDGVGLWFYDVKADITKLNNAKSPMLSGPTNNLGVFASCDAQDANGRAWLASMIGKVCTSNGSEVKSDHLMTLSCNTLASDNTVSSSPSPRHISLSLGTPNQTPVGGKALAYPVSVGGNRSLQFLWNELKFNGSDWGDNGEVSVSARVEVGSDLNNNTLMYGCSELAIPYGYTGQDARVGTQVVGVDR